jgi:Tol biopolymer transport system component
MSPFAKTILSLSTTAYWIFLNFGCSTQNAVGPDLPDLTDPIPFDRLGQGKLVFERDWRMYVIDIDHQSTWGIKVDGCDHPSVSPDGGKIAYSADSGLNSIFDIFIMNIDGKNKMRVSDIIGQESYSSWTFDGRQILFSAFLFDNTLRRPLYRQSPVPNPVDRVKINEDLYVFGRVSASFDGRLAFSSQGGIWTLNIDGSHLKQVLTAGHSRQLLSPAWSPDGQKIAFVSTLRDSSYRTISMDIGLITAEGGIPDILSTLAVGGLADYSLCWSPDGSKIAFNLPDSADQSHIYLINKDGTDLTQVTTAGRVMDSSLSWSR